MNSTKSRSLDFCVRDRAAMQAEPGCCQAEVARMDSDDRRRGSLTVAADQSRCAVLIGARPNRED
jgi:hypothetical protein